MRHKKIKNYKGIKAKELLELLYVDIVWPFKVKTIGRRASY